MGKLNDQFLRRNIEMQNKVSQKQPPLITNSMVKSVSAERRAGLEEEVEKGLYRDGSGGMNSSGLTPLSAVTSFTSSRKKTAQVLSTDGVGGSGGYRGPGGTVRQIPEIYSPLWLSSNLNLPRDRATINAWCRSFYALQPFVQNAINLHSTYPISKLSIKCPNKKIEKFFNDMIEEIDLMNICVQVAQEYWLLGEAFVYAELDERNAKWSRLVIQNPDYVVVKKSVIASEPLIMLRPDENLRRIVFSNRPADLEQKSQLNSTIIEHIRRGENIPMDNFYISHLARRISPYEVRGTGLPVCCFRQLMLFDKIREAKFAQADNMINPITLIKVGSADYKPTAQDLEAWRETFENAQYDKDFKIITHEAVTVEYPGHSQGIYDTSGDITQILKEVFMGLMVPDVLMSGSGDVTYANGGISLDVLRQRYMQFRNMLSVWLRKKIFAPISKLNEFYDFEEGQKKLIIPEIDWNHMSLFDTADFVNVLVQLSGEQKKVSQQTLYRSLGLEYEEERRKIKKEDISDAIRTKELASLAIMPLNELRALGDEDEIPETQIYALPGQDPSSIVQQPGQQMPGGPAGLPPLPGAPPGGMGGDMGLGAPPSPAGGAGLGTPPAGPAGSLPPAPPAK
jgi:hypothetical protein